MKFEWTGGPAYPTLTGGVVDENTYRFEGATLFDYYAAAVLMSGGTPAEACEEAKVMIELRKHYLIEDVV